MSGLEKKRLELELRKVETARHELEFRVLEREEEIKRIFEHIEIQKQKELELKEKLK